MKISLVRPDEGPLVAKILESAVTVIAARGYHGTSMREIAKHAGISPGSIYNHFDSKHELLVTIISRGGSGLLAATEQALFDAPKHPAAQLKAIVGEHVRRHLTYPLESLIGNSELRSLERASRRLVISLRDSQQRMFERVVKDGVEQRIFLTTEPIDAARFITSACTSVSRWYREDGPSTAEEIVDRYQRLALNLVAFRADDERYPELMTSPAVPETVYLRG